MPQITRNTEYLLGYSVGEQRQLRRQTEELAVDSLLLLNQLSLQPGDRAVDVGCGPRGILDQLSERHFFERKPD
jgi:hypothetical protein